MSARLTTVHIGWPVMILTSVAFHVIVAACLLYRAANADLVVLSGLDGVSGTFGLGHVQLAVFLIALAVLALAGVVLENRVDVRICTLLVTPQYSVMLWALCSDALLVYNGVNPANQMPLNRSLLLTVSAAVICIAVGHTVAFIERYVLRWLR